MTTPALDPPPLTPDGTAGPPGTPDTPPRGARSAAARRALGDYGERVAARHLLDRGLVLLARNWRCAEGELDLVLRDGAVLVGCEVKTRTGNVGGTPHEAITPAKLARLHRLIDRFAHEHGLADRDRRVDLVAVHRPRQGAAVVEHVVGLAS